MKQRSALVLLLATFAAALVAAQAGYAGRAGDLVFVQTNELSGNQVFSVERAEEQQIAATTGSQNLAAGSPCYARTLIE